LEGMADLLDALIQGLRIDLPSYQLGRIWFIFTVLVPALWVTHVMAVKVLVPACRRAGPRQLPARDQWIAEPC
jgi:hypothetical protein